MKSKLNVRGTTSVFYTVINCMLIQGQFFGQRLTVLLLVNTLLRFQAKKSSILWLITCLNVSFHLLCTVKSQTGTCTITLQKDMANFKTKWSLGELVSRSAHNDQPTCLVLLTYHNCYRMILLLIFRRRGMGLGWPKFRRQRCRWLHLYINWWKISPLHWVEWRFNGAYA